MSRILEPLEKEINNLRGHEFVEDVDIDDDCLPEGWLDVHIKLEEKLVPKICEEEGFNTEEWNESELI